MPIHPAHMVPDGTIPKTYVHQEYPKWVKGVIVNSEGEEQDLLQASEGSDENPAIVDEVTVVPDDQQNATDVVVETPAKAKRRKS